MTHHQTLQRGQAMIVATMFFLGVALTIIYGLAGPVFNQQQIVSGLFQSHESYYLAESGMEDTLYRLKNRLPVNSSGQTTALGNFSASTVTTNTGSGKIVTTTSNWNGNVRKVSTTLTTGVGVAFNYGIQSGDGGFVLNGGAQITGNVYSNGDIVATNGVTITGSAVAADSAALTADQTNDSPTVPPNSITFRNASASEDFAQSFQLSSSSPINKISLYIKKVGNPADATVRIVSDSSGVPGTNNLLATNGTLSASLVGTSGFGWVDVVFPDNPTLTTGTTYWVVIDDGSQNSNNYYVLGANATYATGAAKVGKYSGTWNNTSPSGLDGYFRIYLGGLTSTIGGATYTTGAYVGQGGVGDAWAHNVQGVTVAGSLYCQTGQYNNKACNTSKPDPSPQPMPISDANIQDWKSQAQAGGTTSGNVTIGSAGGTLGPRVITGNLLVNGGGTLTVTGTIYVQGTFTVTGGGKVKLDPSFGTQSGVILADGIVSLAGGGSMTGSGQPGSYILVLSTSNCPLGPSCDGADALTLSGGAGAVILSAPYGNMTLNGGSGVHEASAYKITATGGAQITYDAGLINEEFSSGPSGGWDINSWQEVQ